MIITVLKILSNHQNGPYLRLVTRHDMQCIWHNRARDTRYLHPTLGDDTARRSLHAAATRPDRTRIFHLASSVGGMGKLKSASHDFKKVFRFGILHLRF